MMTKRIGTFLLVLFLVILSATAFAGPNKGWRGSGGWGTNGKYQQIYNPATVATLSGEVLAVERITPMKGMGTGIHLQFKTDKETISVHLGPSWYIERLDETIAKGDTVEVKGSRVTVAGKPALIAAEVKKGDVALVLRNDQGIPVWAGWRR